VVVGSFRYSSWIDAPVEVLFAFHEHPKALERLTPPHQKVEVLERTNGIQEGSRVVIRSHVGPFPIVWHALHTVYIKDRLFVDEQESGPFRTWIHRHEFASEENGSRLTDSISYQMKGGVIAEAFGGWIVQWQLKTMFTWRHNVTKLFCEKTA
jgi:ligand-binding SRPBCC domain-containing protein